MKMQRALARLFPLALLAASCGVGGMLAASGGGGGGGGGGDTNPPPPPTVTVVAPAERAVGDLVTFSFVLKDDRVKPETNEGRPGRPGGADDPRVRVRAQWEDPNAPGTWYDMSEADLPQSEGTRTLSLGQHSFVWNTLPDLGGVTVQNPRTGDEAPRFRVRVRVLAEYEETAGLNRKFRSRDAVFTIDNRFTGTILGDLVEPGTDIDSVPVALRADGDSFIVAVFGPNIVERVDGDGLVRRLLGFGLPGNTVGSTVATGKSPGVARLQTLIGLVLDGNRNLYTNHSTRILVTNQGPAPLTFGATTVPPFTVVEGIAGLQDSRDVRFHPSGALVFLDRADSVVAFNPQDPSSPASTPIVLAGVAVAPGAATQIAGGGASTADGAAAASALLENAIALAIGPDGEIYWIEQSAARVRVLNTGTTDLVVGGNTVTAGTVRTVAGSFQPGFENDDDDLTAPRLATESSLNLPSGIDVSAARVLYIADTGNVRVRLANLGVADATFAGRTVAPGFLRTVAGGGAGGVGSTARELQFARPNAVSIDANGNLLVADERTVIFVNGGTTTVTSYGKTARASRTTRVYDASRRGGVPLAEPRAVHSSSPTEVFFTDRATVRVLNLSRDERTFGGEAAAAGASTIVGGGAVPGFGGDGGSGRNAAFAFPSALATQGTLRLFVADTGNDRIRLINLGDPRLSSVDTDAYLGQTVLPGNVATVVGGSPFPLFQDGDGGPAGTSSLSAPEGVAIGPDGLMWIADTGHHRIRVVNPGSATVIVSGVAVGAGSIQTLLGDGAPGFTPDGAGPWQISSPAAVTLDNAGILYFAERGNSRIRCFNPTAAAVERAGISVPAGEVRTLVGTGVPGNSGDGGDGPSAQIDAPRGLFVQSGDGTPVSLYFSDDAQNVVRMLNLTPATDLALATDEEGRTIVTIPAASVATVAGGPNTPGFPNAPAFAGDGAPASEARFNAPFGIAVTTSAGRNAHFFVADRRNDRLRRFGAPPLVN